MSDDSKAIAPKKRRRARAGPRPLRPGDNVQRAVIRIQGHLDQKWAEWFEGFDLKYTRSGDTILAGPVRDQAALYGLIGKLRDLGIKLKGVRYLSSSPPEEGPESKPRE